MKLMTLTAAVLCVAASGAFAKGHDQGNTAVPGAENVGSATVATAQAFGGLKGSRPDDKAPSEISPATENAGR